MTRINLLPRKEAEVAFGRRNQQSLVLLAVVVTILVMLVPYLTQQRRITRLERDVAETQRQLSRYSEQVKEVEQLDRLKADLETKLSIIEDLNQERVGPQRVLSDLSIAAPEKLWLIEFTEVGAGATITGIALDNETIADFMRRLQGSKYFFNVDLVETAESKEVNLAGFKRFIVKATLDYEGRGGAVPGEDGKTQPAAAVNAR